MIDNITVGKTISMLRQNRGLTQQQLAAALSVSHQAVSKWENGVALPDIQTMMALTKFFGITVEQLVNGEVPEEKSESTPKTIDDHLQNIGNFVNSVVDGIFKPVRKTDTEIHEDSSESPVERPEDESCASRKFDSENREASEAAAFDVKKLLQMAPYMSKKAVDDLLIENKAKLTAGDIARFAPYISRECLEKLIESSESEITWETLQRIAPFLKREMVDSLARAAAKGERFVKQAMDQTTKATEDIGKTLEDVSQKIGKRVEKAIRKATKLGEEMVNGVSAAFEEAMVCNQPQLSRAEMLRNAAFERALQDEKWDWIAAHAAELSDEELKKRIIKRADDLNMQEWLMEHISGYVDLRAVDSAMASKNWEWLAAHIGQFETEVQDRILLAAVEASEWQWIYDNGLQIAGDNCIYELAELAYKAEEFDFVITIMESRLDRQGRERLMDGIIAQGDFNLLSCTAHLFEDAYLGTVCLAWAMNGHWNNIGEFVSRLDSEHVEKLMELAIAEGNFEAIDMLNEYLK